MASLPEWLIGHRAYPDVTSFAASGKGPRDILCHLEPSDAYESTRTFLCPIKAALHNEGGFIQPGVHLRS